MPIESDLSGSKRLMSETGHSLSGRSPYTQQTLAGGISHIILAVNGSIPFFENR